MLLDQKRTKRMVQVAAILTSIAFVGIFPLVLFGIVFGGGGSSSAHGGEDFLGPAQVLVEERPRDPDAWSELADARLLSNDVDGAIEAQQRAVTLDPRNLDRATTLVQIYTQADDAEAALSAIETFTERNPTNAEAFRLLGTLAAQAGRNDLARLAYQTFLRLAPDNPDADLVRDAIAGLESGAPPQVDPHGG